MTKQKHIHNPELPNNLDTETGELKPPKFRTQYNFALTDPGIEHPTGESLTIPGQSYTVRELLEKFTTGIPLDLFRQGVYDQDEEPDIELSDPTREPDFDLADRVTIQNHINQTLHKHSKTTTKPQPTTTNSEPHDEKQNMTAGDITERKVKGAKEEE